MIIGAFCAMAVIAQSKSDVESIFASKDTDIASWVKTQFSQQQLKEGAVKDWGRALVAAVELDGAAHNVVLDLKGGEPIPMKRRGSDGLYVGMKVLPQGAGYPGTILVDGKEKKSGLQIEVYAPNPLSQTPPGGLRGELRQMPPLESKIYSGTTRKWYVYLPPNYDRNAEHPLLVGQDAQWDRNWHSAFLDNMIATGELPPVVGVFIEPGTKDREFSNRNREYDTLSDEYVSFLETEVLPEVQKLVKLSPDPKRRAITGNSSGGICSFTACWERPDLFSTALSFIGSYTNLSPVGNGFDGGGHNYPPMIRKMEKRPIRAFIQDGANDLDNRFGNWFLANQEMVRALEFSGYEVRWVPGNGFHSSKHARAIFQDALSFWKEGW